MTERLLVTGTAGKLGGSVVTLLLDEFGVEPDNLIAGTRDPDKLVGLAKRGVAIRTVDFNKPETLAASFSGVDRLLLVSTDAIGSRLAGQKSAVAAARAAGVKGIVYTSAPSPHGDNHPLLFAGDHASTETAIFDSGLAYRILRNNWYQENLLRSLPAVLKSGVWLTSEKPGTRVSYVAHDDCARVAAAALALPWNDDRATFDITGPEALTLEDLAALVTDTLAKPIKVVHLSPEELAANLKSAGLPNSLIALMLSMDATNNAGLLAGTSNSVETLTGHRPRTVSAFLEANRAALAEG